VRQTLARLSPPKIVNCKPRLQLPAARRALPLLKCDYALPTRQRDHIAHPIGRETLRSSQPTAVKNRKKSEKFERHSLKNG
jgi:hypothetical protein